MPTTEIRNQGTHRVGELGGDHLATPVRDLMTPGVVTIAEDASLTQAFRAIRAHDVHAVLVVGAQHGKPLGWITARGLLAWVGRDSGLVHARDAVSERAVTIEPGAGAREALVALSQADTTHLLVSRGRDRPAEGVVSAVNLIALERG
jgi:CBS domain-containing protein